MLLFVFAASVNVAGQNLVVKKFFHAERDGTANRGSTCIMDQNDEPCALIKVRTNQRGFTFDAGQLLPIEKTEEQTSAHPLEIYVWVQSGVKRLSIGHAQLGNLYDYDLGTALQPGQTYILELVSGEVQTVVKQARSHQYVVFQLTPPNAVVTIGGEMLETNDGIARKLMKMGKYNYTVQAPNYQQEVGRIEVNNPDEKHVVNVTLKPNFTQVTLTAPDGAEIWVNGERKGTGSWKGNLNGGDYLFETKKASHRDAQLTKTIDLSEGPQTIQLPAPTPILGDADFDSKPAMADIYIDGKKVGQTPQLVSNLLVGSHTVKLVRSGYNDYTGNITIKEGETAPFSATLIKGSLSETASGEGEVILLCKSLTADIYVDGRKVGTGRWEGKLSAGRHTVSCRALNFKNADATIEVVGGQKKFFQLEAPQKGSYNATASNSVTGEWEWRPNKEDKAMEEMTNIVLTLRENNSFKIVTKMKDTDNIIDPAIKEKEDRKVNVVIVNYINGTYTFDGKNINLIISDTKDTRCVIEKIDFFGKTRNEVAKNPALGEKYRKQIEEDWADEWEDDIKDIISDGGLQVWNIKTFNPQRMVVITPEEEQYTFNRIK